MTEFNLVVGGHSNLPDHVSDIHNTNITVCKLRGAKLDHFWEHSSFRPMRESNHDLAILFLGGNDIYENCEPKVILSKLIKIAEHLQHLNKKVVIVTLEPRQYQEGNRFNISTQTYERVSNMSITNYARY